MTARVLPHPVARFPGGERTGSIVEAVRNRARAGASCVRRMAIAEIPIDLGASPEVEALVGPPFAHLEASDEGDAALDIRVAPLLRGDLGAFGLSSLGENGAIESSDDGSIVVHLQQQSAVVLDRGAARIDALVAPDARHASWQRAKPLQVPLSIFFADRSVDFVHCGLVSIEGRGVLLAGASGSGKSTASIASLLGGFDYLGDDCVAVQRTASGFDGYSVYGMGCLDPLHAASFAALHDDATHGDGKSVIDVARLRRHRAIARTSIRAIVLPEITGGASVSIDRTSAKDALLTLAPGSILKRAVPAVLALRRIGDLARAVPAFRMRMGPVAGIAPAVRRLLEDLA